MEYKLAVDDEDYFGTFSEASMLRGVELADSSSKVIPVEERKVPALSGSKGALVPHASDWTKATDG